MRGGKGPGRGRPDAGRPLVAQTRACAGLETRVAEVPRLGPRRQPIARAGGDQLPGERGPGREPWPGAGPPRTGWGRSTGGGAGSGRDRSGSANSSVLNLSTITSPSACAGASTPPCRRFIALPRGGRGPAGAVPNQVHDRSGGSGDRWDSPRTVADGCSRGPPGGAVTAGLASRGGDGPGQRSSYRRASSWRRPGRSRRGPPAPANRWARAWGRRRRRGGWRRRGYSSWIGSPGVHSRPVRSAGPQPVWSTGLSGSSRSCSPRSPASIRAWNSGAESASTALSTARRRAFSSGVGVPKRRVVGASEEISVKESDRPLQQSVGRLNSAVTPSPGNRRWISPRPVDWCQSALATQI